MKKCPFFTMILFIPFILTACISPVTPDLLDDPSPRQDLPASKNELYMTVGEPEEGRGGGVIELNITNSGDALFGYGEFFYIEKKIDDQWYMLAFDDMVFSDFSQFDNYGKVISPGETDEVRIDPKEYLLTMDSGTYRIVKAFRYHDDENVFWLTDEFIVT